MSAKSSGAAADDYAEFDADKAKAGEAPYELVTLKRYRVEDIRPEIARNKKSRTCIVWPADPKLEPRTATLQHKSWGLSWVDDWDCDLDFTGTSWAYIPEVTT